MNAKTFSQNTKPSTENGKRLFMEGQLWIIFGITLMAVLGVASIAPVLPRISSGLGISEKNIGLIITVFTLPGILLTPLFGFLADLWGRKTVLVPALFLFGFAGGACAFTEDLDLLLLFRLLQGIGAACLGALNITLVGDLYEGPQRKQAMGYNASVLSIGTASYPTLGGILASLDWHYPFLLALFAFPIALATMLWLREPAKTEKQHLFSYIHKASDYLLSRKAVAIFLIFLIIFIALYGSYLIYLPLLLSKGFDYNSMEVGLFVSMMSASTAITSFNIGRISKKFSSQVLIFTGSLLYLVSLLLFPLTLNIYIIAFANILFGIAQGLSIPLLQTLLAGIAPLKYRGAVMAINGTFLRIGQTAGPLLIGSFYAWYNFEGAFFGGAVFVAMMILIILNLFVENGDRKEI